MIITKDSDRETLGRMVGERVEMKFSDAARGILMDNFAKNLYSRPKEAVLREYSTNAWDAQIEIGESRPLEITLPSPLRPILEIRDFGVGLDQQGIVDVYSQYGASTKRESNDFNGTLGLGGKSAFAYSDQFNVVSIKDGVRIEVQVTRNADGTGDMVTVDERESTEPRGTLIKIPTKRGDDFRAEAEKLYRWFPEGSVKVNGTMAKHFDPVAEEAIQVDDGLWVVKTSPRAYRYDESDDFIVMGMIAYPTRLETGLPRHKYHVVAHIPMGEVQFNPSRETLLNNSITRRGLASVLDRFKKGIVSTVQEHIDAAPSRSQAASVVANWKDIVPVKMAPPGGYEYRGQAIPSSLNIAMHEPLIRHLSTNKNGYHNSHSKSRSVSLEYFAGTLWIEGYSAEKVSTAQAQKARKYIADNQLSVPKGIVLISDIPAAMRPWIETIVPYDTIKAVKLPQTPRTSSGISSGRIPGSYDLFTTEPTKMVVDGNGNKSPHRRMEGVPAEEFKSWTPPLYYHIGNSWQSGYIREGLEAVAGSKGYTLVCIGTAREAKLKRGFPTIQKATDVIKAGWNAWQAGVGADAALAIAIQGDYTLREYKHLDESQIDDAKLAKYVRLSKMDLTTVRSQANVFSRVLGVSITQPDLVDFEASYPLLEVPRWATDSRRITHLHHYVNSVYAARQAGATL